MDGLCKVWYLQELLKLNSTEQQALKWNGTTQFEVLKEAGYEVFQIEMNHPSQEEDISSMTLIPNSSKVITTSLKNPTKIWNTENGMYSL